MSDLSSAPSEIGETDPLLLYCFKNLNKVIWNGNEPSWRVLNGLYRGLLVVLRLVFALLKISVLFVPVGTRERNELKFELASQPLFTFSLDFVRSNVTSCFCFKSNKSDDFSYARFQFNA